VPNFTKFSKATTKVEAAQTFPQLLWPVLHFAMATSAAKHKQNKENTVWKILHSRCQLTTIQNFTIDLQTLRYALFRIIFILLFLKQINQ